MDSIDYLDPVVDTSHGPNAGLFAPAMANTDDLLVPSLTLFAVFKQVLQQRGEDEALQVVAVMQQAKVIDLDSRIALEAAKISHDRGLPPELAAHAAHEVGHEYFWCDYAAARLGNPAEFHKLEFRCDAVAALTMVGLGFDPEALLRGVAKLNRFNKGIGAMANAACYPSLQERRRVVQALVETCGGPAQARALPSQ